ncbi:N-formylglutamate amidohydrolase [uncultured Roseobacter sp.]|uniref:N-formylglutamate amidohydrolase n=1 Tax=uncultured Roseobacter sp. TaxID=114847 RepID=UPI00260CFF06|nr:N-formylglutamate amidohydrolase [uncultured Roseobacter sp.]
MPVTVISGSSPLILAVPHASTDIPNAILGRMTEAGQAMMDTDWHVDRLVSGLVEDATIVRANFHRYLCNANADPRDLAKQNLRAIVPAHTFNDQPIWRVWPEPREISRWTSAFHAPYHAAIAAQVARLRAMHGFALIVDCKASRSEVLSQTSTEPPDITLRTFLGAGCNQQLSAKVAGLLMQAKDYRTTISERGDDASWTVQRHGQPKRHVQALQLVLRLSTYLTEEADPWLYDPEKAEPLRHLIAHMLQSLQEWRPNYAASYI